jgi:hypothetical protein
MSKFSGPFDWMYIDIETAVSNIRDSFSNYLDDIVIVKKNENIVELLNCKNTDTIKDGIMSFFDLDPVYMKHKYGEQLLPINQNFLGSTPGDIYQWDRTCVFLHHDLRRFEEVEKIKVRISRFVDTVNVTPEETLLFYISKILEFENVDEEISKLSNLYKSIDKRLNVVSILCCPYSEERSYKIDNMLFIVKKVPAYREQYEKYETDNNFEWLEWGMQGLNFDKEFKIIENYYQFNLIDKEEI